MHGQSETPNLSDDALLRRASVLRSSQPEDPRHRLQTDDDPSRQREGQQGTLDPSPTEALERAQDLLNSNTKG